jgi:hypothetical protein
MERDKEERGTTELKGNFSVVGTPKGGGGEKWHIGSPYLFLFPQMDIFGPVGVTRMKVSFSN